MLKTIDLFAGAGGLSLGFQQTGKFEIVAAAEINENARKTYQLNISSDNPNFTFINKTGTGNTCQVAQIRDVKQVVVIPYCIGNDLIANSRRTFHIHGYFSFVSAKIIFFINSSSCDMYATCVASLLISDSLMTGGLPLFARLGGVGNENFDSASSGYGSFPSVKGTPFALAARSSLKNPSIRALPRVSGLSPESLKIYKGSIPSQYRCQAMSLKAFV